MIEVRLWLTRVRIMLFVVVVLIVACTGVAWWKFFKSEPQLLACDQAGAASCAQARFEHGSLGGEAIAGIPYPIFMILPRIFPDLVEQYAKDGYGPDKPGWGGYGAFGLAWEQGQRLPDGFSIKRLGYERVTINCALCHTATYRLSANADRVFVPGGPGHTVDLQGLLRFLFAVSHDRRFTAARLLPEIAVHFPLDWLDWKVYSFILIPQMRAALRLAEHELGWMDARPAWGPGRDDAFNLPKFILLQQAWDASVGTTKFPALWRLADRDGTLLHSGGEAKTVYAVIATSAFGIGSPPDAEFAKRNEDIVAYVRTLPAPKYPGTIDQARSARGQAIYAARCAACHAAGGARTGSAIPVAEIGTDPEHVRTWTEADAQRMNHLTEALGMTGAALQGAQGYVAKPLVGVWLLGPYLHNGSVPTLMDLLSPPGSRPAVFYCGYDVLDQERVGFVSTGPDAAAGGFRFDTGLRGNGNGGHVYGADLDPGARGDLIEFLKTL